MPYKDPAAQREYQRQWAANRRAEYLTGQCCVLCGSGESLEIDHSNPRLKVEHRIWTWSRPRLEAELSKCIVLCARCHRERHALERAKHGAGGYKRGCRCGVCREWKRGSNARYYERKKDPEPTVGSQAARGPRTTTTTKGPQLG